MVLSSRSTLVTSYKYVLLSNLTDSPRIQRLTQDTPICLLPLFSNSLSPVFKIVFGGLSRHVCNIMQNFSPTNKISKSELSEFWKTALFLAISASRPWH